MNLYEDLMWRGLIKDMTSDDLKEKLNDGSLTFYIGTDPTADSMHIGHYSSFINVLRLIKAGHKGYLLVGGGTGLIGDPKPTSERPMITKEAVEKNFEALKHQAETLFNCEVVNNYEWLSKINIFDYLRDYGKYFSVSYMLNKDIIKRRLETGITYTEFSYTILQAIDYYFLNQNYHVNLQIAGSDQWGNITSGIELINRKTESKAYGIVMPLVLDENGNKIGKSEGNALWLDKNKTSSYEMYQYLINTSDVVVIDYLKKMTLLSKEEIEEIEKIHYEAPEKRYAQEVLAREIISHIHSAEDYLEAKKISEALFKGSVKDIPLESLEDVFKNVPSKVIKGDMNLISFIAESGAASSKREAREFISSGSILINGEKIDDLDYTITDKDNFGDYIIVRRGKKKYFLIKRR